MHVKENLMEAYKELIVEGKRRVFQQSGYVNETSEARILW